MTNDLTQAIQSTKSGAVEFRVERAGQIHAGVGKASFGDQQLTENILAFVGAVQRAKPSGAKGTYVRKITLSSTMGDERAAGCGQDFGRRVRRIGERCRRCRNGTGDA